MKKVANDSALLLHKRKKWVREQLKIDTKYSSTSHRCKKTQRTNCPWPYQRVCQSSVGRSDTLLDEGRDQETVTLRDADRKAEPWPGRVPCVPQDQTQQQSTPGLSLYATPIRVKYPVTAAEQPSLWSAHLKGNLDTQYLHKVFHKETLFIHTVMQHHKITGFKHVFRFFFPLFIPKSSPVYAKPTVC